MAYLTDLDRTCDRCKARRATKRLFNRVNAPSGDYCAPCSKLALKQMQQREQPITERPRIERGGTHTGA